MNKETNQVAQLNEESLRTRLTENRSVFIDRQLEFKRQRARDPKSPTLVDENELSMLSPSLNWEENEGSLRLAFGHRDGQDELIAAACYCKDCNGWVSEKPRKEEQRRFVTEKTANGPVRNDEYLGEAYYCHLCKSHLVTTQEEIKLPPDEVWAPTDQTNRKPFFEGNK